MRARRLRSILRRLQTKQCLCLLVLVAGAILLTRPYGTRATAVDPALWKAHRQLSTPVAGDVRVVPWHAGAPPMSTPAANDLGHEHNAATARDARHPESADGANASLVEHVYTLAGSEINKRISYGNVLPYVSRPHAFSYWVPMTAAMNDNNKIEDPWYSASHRRIYGIRCSHQPSLWIGDWAFFLLSFVLKADFAQTGGYYDSAEAIWRPHLFWTAYKMTAACAAVVEVTSTMHGAMVRSIVPASCSNKPPVVRFFFGPGKHSKSLEVHPHEDEDGLIAVGGSTRKSGHGMTQPMDLFFYATISTEQDSKPSCIDDFTLEVSSKQKRFLVVSHSCASADSRGDWVQTVRVATSLISVEQAKLNYNRQLRSQTFRQVLQSSKDEWNLLLRRHQVVESGLNDAEEKEALQIVYTCLYRFLLFPSKLHEINSTGGIVHMSAYTEPHEVQLQHKCSTGFESIQIDPAPVLGNAAFLSTLRCVLVTIIRVVGAPTHATQSLTNHCVAGRWLLSLLRTASLY